MHLSKPFFVTLMPLIIRDDAESTNAKLLPRQNNSFVRPSEILVAPLAIRSQDFLGACHDVNHWWGGFLKGVKFH